MNDRPNTVLHRNHRPEQQNTAASDCYLPAMPDKPGTYLIRCMETDYEWSKVEVYRQDGILKVDCPDLGRGYFLQHYHDGLTDVKWKFAGW